MFTGMTISGASLKLLQVGEQATIARFIGSNPSLGQELDALGLSPGVAFTVEQRSPQFVIRTERSRLTLAPHLINAIYTRTSLF